MDSLIAVKISIILHRSIREELYDGIQAEDQIRGSTRPGLRSRDANGWKDDYTNITAVQNAL